ncbi:MAG: diacylglycerol kinase family protein, partial [Eubacteriales bacterium]|nr:diacylglycerol kinase family protein [Eubacteriales bacterium]
MKYYLYNSKANNGLKPDVPVATELVNVLGLDYKDFFKSLDDDDEVVLIGGDGTLNVFVNQMEGVELKHKVYLLGAGTGNDFFTDIGKNAGEEVYINDYIKNLPKV